MLRTKGVLAALGIAALGAAAAASAAIAPIKEYAVSVVPGYETVRLLSAGDTVPETSNPAKQYQMVGIPDGLGAHPSRRDTVTVYMNHELTGSTLSEPVLGDPLNRGAFVSKLVVDEDGDVLSGERAYDTVFNENTLVGPAAAVGNATRGFSRFCSGSLAGPEQGFDRYIYLTNEEEGTPANTFDTLGGVSVAIFDNELHTLPKLGHFAKENTLVQRNPGNRTVVISLEDGPASLDPAVENSQVYMYVGRKDNRHGAGVLGRNGLDNGALYVLAAGDPTRASEADFASGTIPVTWVEIPGAEAMTEAQLDAASDAAGAIRFGRPEDGAYNLRDRNEFFFVTTGESAGANVLGRLYSLRLQPGDPTKPGSLTVVYNADQVIAGGGDIAISPDNIDVSRDYLMIDEDGTADSRAVMENTLHREGSIWRFDIVNGFVGVDVSSAVRVAALDPPGRDGVDPGIAGTWETSGIIDASGLFGRGTWMFDVQAHAATTAPAPNTVEDGQLLLLVPRGEDDDGHGHGHDDDDGHGHGH
jgi:hypothetical protein